VPATLNLCVTTRVPRHLLALLPRKQFALRWFHDCRGFRLLFFSLPAALSGCERFELSR